MEKEGLELGSFTQKVAAEYAVDSALLSMMSHNLVQKKVPMIGRIHQNEQRNPKIRTVMNLHFSYEGKRK
jgi:hypothetical protein